MFARIALFLLLGLGLAGFGALAWFNMHPAAPPATAEATPPSDKTAFLAAARPLRAGTLLKPEDVTVEQRSANDAPAGARIESESARSELLGALVRRNLAKGDLLLVTDALNPGDRGFLAAVLDAGMRAVTVGVDAVSGLSGLVWPGDRVDLILTQMQDRADVPVSRRVSGETVLHDVRVLAIDRQLIQGATSESPESQAAKTVTLEVTPSGAERVMVAARLGHLSLAVVAVSPEPTPSPTPTGNGITWGGDVSSALGGGPATGGATVRLFQGPSDTKEVHF
ncbi:MAG TPA: Flp pilus assembly protein CpaB [Acetobacteraceae bacterium]|nr:Flp pilus assembly protein CpaB [Acetobacteraceae bacterium]